MTSSIIDGLTISLIVLIASVILAPVLCWVLPDRAVEPHHSSPDSLSGEITLRFDQSLTSC